MFIIWLYWSIICGIYGQDFITDTEECSIPHFDAFSTDSKPTYYQLPYVNCSDRAPLTYTTVENNIAYLRIRAENIDQYYSSDEQIDCCYSYVTRKGTRSRPDVGIRTTRCLYFNSTVRLHHYIVMVKCNANGNLIYENVHHPIVMTDVVKDKIKNPASTTNKPLSVLFIVIDSVSRLNLIRTMPKTRNFLLANDFVEFQAYNKIDDNTFPNFNALLTGLNLAQSRHICRPDEVGMLDRCPMIWYDFRRRGYVTAYAEDWAGIATFNYRKKGFSQPPTDYYFKAYVEASETLRTRIEDSMPYCAGPEVAGERILNLVRDFAFTFKSYPSFGIFWMNTFSHNHINSPSRMDDKLAEFFHDLGQEGILNDSAVILLSDHGIRYGDIRTTAQGWYEERLPMNLISLPPWFRQTHPDKYKNLVDNSKKLTSTYDLYMTLREILKMASGNEVVTKSQACPTCQSLFTQIPEPRSCKQAGVGEFWCTCLGKFETLDRHSNYTEIIDTASEILTNLVPGYHRITKMYLAVSKKSTGHSYLLIIFNRFEENFYQILYRIQIEPLVFSKNVRVLRLN